MKSVKKDEEVSVRGDEKEFSLLREGLKIEISRGHHRHKISKTKRVRYEDGVAVLTFDHPDSSANVFDRETLLELEEAIAWVEMTPKIKALVLVSSKPKVFVAGADLHSLRWSSPEEMEAYLHLGQEVFTRLEALKVPTVAAIHGACLGGGLEVALACDVRVASAESVTQLGLPETKIGLVPAWGGSTRLPRLLGLSKALGMILTGRTVGAKAALKLGLVDGLYPQERLVDMAGRHALGEMPVKRRRKFFISNLWPLPKLYERMARRKLLQKTRGNYPAVEKALSLVCEGVTHHKMESLRLERETIRALVDGPDGEVARNLMDVFFLRERAKHLHHHAIERSRDAKPMTKVGVLGAGVMGSEMAACFGQKGCQVYLKDVEEDALAAGMKRVHGHVLSAKRRGKCSALEMRQTIDRVQAVLDRDFPRQQTDLVIEAASESLEVKKAIFKELSERFDRQVILATNTSALPLSKIASKKWVQHPERVLGLHFFNPVSRMPLVEVVVGAHSDPVVVERGLRFVKAMGKLPVVVQDSPGFVVNRVLMPYLMRAVQYVSEGVPMKCIDQAMLDFGMPMGPLRLLDEVGLDIATHVAGSLSETKVGAHLKLPKLCQEMVEAGMLGRKSGEGFYRYQEGKVVGSNQAVKALVNPGDRLLVSRDEVKEMLSLLMVLEAARCVEEKIVRDVRDVDFAMIMGTGFAPFRGGPLRYADHVGSAELLERVSRLGLTPVRMMERLHERKKGWY